MIVAGIDAGITPPSSASAAARDHASRAGPLCMHCLMTHADNARALVYGGALCKERVYVEEVSD